MSNLTWGMARYDLLGLGYRPAFLGSALHRLGEIGEKFIGQFLGRTIDQALPELRQLAADLRLDIVSQQSAVVLFGQRHGRTTLGEARDTALAFAGYLVAIRRVEIAQRDPALEAGRHRPDLHLGDGTKTAVFGLLQLLASGDAGLQHFRIVQLGPHDLTRRR